MRKLIVTIGIVISIAVGAASVAQAASGSRATGRCNTGVPGGNQYYPACTKPSLSFKTPSPECRNTGPAYKLPNLTFVSNAGLRQIEIIFKKPIKVIKFSGRGPTQYKLDGLSLKTAGLLAGPHSVTIEVRDVRGKTATRTLRFTICVAKPVFTG